MPAPTSYKTLDDVLDATSGFGTLARAHPHAAGLARHTTMRRTVFLTRAGFGKRWPLAVCKETMTNVGNDGNSDPQSDRKG